MLLDPRPAPAIGQIWAVRGADALSFLALVVDQHEGEITNTAFVNLAPVTEDARLAAEWSLAFGLDDSGVGTPVVIHIDFEQSVNPQCLDRCIGRLLARAGTELVRVLQAWSASEAPPNDLLVGQLGHAEMRTRTEWQAFDKWLSASMQLIRATDE